MTTFATNPQTDDASKWAQLCTTLMEEFPELTGGDVIEIVRQARAATDLFGLAPAEQLQSSATIARNNLEILKSGADLARLDPESHSGRKRDA